MVSRVSTGSEGSAAGAGAALFQLCQHAPAHYLCPRPKSSPAPDAARAGPRVSSSQAAACASLLAAPAPGACRVLRSSRRRAVAPHGLWVGDQQPADDAVNQPEQSARHMLAISVLSPPVEPAPSGGAAAPASRCGRHTHPHAHPSTPAHPPQKPESCAL